MLSLILKYIPLSILFVRKLNLKPKESIELRAEITMSRQVFSCRFMGIPTISTLGGQAVSTTGPSLALSITPT